MKARGDFVLQLPRGNLPGGETQISHTCAHKDGQDLRLSIREKRPGGEDERHTHEVV